MDGDRAIAKILKAEGVEWMAAFPAQTLIDAVAMEGIRPIITRQERAGVNMADGYSRIMNGRKLGVFAMQRGPGAENAFGGVAQGFADNVPFLVLPGGHDRVRFGVHPSFDAVSHYGGHHEVERLRQRSHAHPGDVSQRLYADEAWPSGADADRDAVGRCYGRVSGRTRL